MEKRFGFSYNYPTVPYAQGKALPRSHGDIGGPQHNYVTIPWKVAENVDPDPQNPVSLNSGWTFLYGPTNDAIITAHARIMVVQAGSSLHLRLYKVRLNTDGSETIVWTSESPERFVGNGETHGSGANVSYSSTHLDATWRVAGLNSDERLRLQADYWTAVDPDPDYETGRIVGARVEGHYYRELVS